MSSPIGEPGPSRVSFSVVSRDSMQVCSSGKDSAAFKQTLRIRSAQRLAFPAHPRLLRCGALSRARRRRQGGGVVVQQSRRALLRLLGLTGVAAVAAACAMPTGGAPAAGTPSNAPPAAPPAPAASPSSAGAASSDLASLVDAAKRDGHRAVATYAGAAYRTVMDDFEAAYPGIKVDQTGFQSASRDFFPRFFQERQAGLYQWDVMLIPASDADLQSVTQGAVDPVRPLIVRPDLLADATWNDGFEAGWLDKAKQYSYAITRSRSQSLWVDTQQVKDDEIKSWRDLQDPKSKGKLLAADLRTKGSGFWPGTTLRLKTGSDDAIKQLFKDQEPVLS